MIDSRITPEVCSRVRTNTQIFQSHVLPIRLSFPLEACIFKSSSTKAHMYMCTRTHICTHTHTFAERDKQSRRYTLNPIWEWNSIHTLFPHQGAPGDFLSSGTRCHSGLCWPMVSPHSSLTRAVLKPPSLTWAYPSLEPTFEVLTCWLNKTKISSWIWPNATSQRIIFMPGLVYEASDIFAIGVGFF